MILIYTSKFWPSHWAICWSICMWNTWRILLPTFPDELVEDIMENTNSYASQKGVPMVFTKDDIMGFIGLNIAMGIHRLPGTLHSPWFSTVMLRDKFMAISCFLHFRQQQSTLQRRSQLWSIVENSTYYSKKLREMYTGKKVSIDDWHEGTSIIFTVPAQKAYKVGKVWVLSEAKIGYIYNFDIYTGKGRV